MQKARASFEAKTPEETARNWDSSTEPRGVSQSGLGLRFLEDRTESGRKLRILTVIDEFTREWLTVETEYRMNAKFVAAALLRLFKQRGTPEFVRSDNGPEFIAKHLMRVLATAGVTARHIEPGSPWQNGVDERFNGTLRNECLNMETFHSRDQARAVIKLYGRHYNQHRPDSSLGYQTPAKFASDWARARDSNARTAEYR